MDAPSDKKTLLAQFRQVSEELAVRKRKEREGEHERRKSMWTGGDVRIFALLTSYQFFLTFSSYAAHVYGVPS